MEKLKFAPIDFYNFMPFSAVNYRAMLTVVTTIVCLICYCCHRKIKMQSASSLYRQQRWLESDANMEIYSVEQVRHLIDWMSLLLVVNSHHNQLAVEMQIQLKSLHVHWMSLCMKISSRLFSPGSFQPANPKSFCATTESELGSLKLSLFIPFKAVTSSRTIVQQQ